MSNPPRRREDEPPGPREHPPPRPREHGPPGPREHAPPGPREHGRVDPASLPDPTLWREDREHRRKVTRMLLFGAVALATVGSAALVMRGTVERVAAVRAQAGPLLGLPGATGLPAGLEPPRPAEKPAATPEELAALQRSWVGSLSIAPRDPQIDVETGEQLGAFQGFGVQVDGAQGARVLADGGELGTAPLLASVSCRPGDPVEIRVERSGRSFTHRTRCRKDVLLKLAPDLGPPPR